jgi:hypothetical protein
LAAPAVVVSTSSGRLMPLMMLRFGNVHQPKLITRKSARIQLLKVQKVHCEEGMEQMIAISVLMSVMFATLL